MRAGPIPGISSSGLFTNSFLRRARWVPMAKRCASSRRRWMKNNAGSRGVSLNGLASLDKEGLAPRVAVGAFGDRDQPHALDAKRGQDFPRGLELPPAAVDDDKVGRIGKGAVGSAVSPCRLRRAKRRVNTSRIIA